MCVCDAKFSYFSKFQKTKIVLCLKVINKCYFAISRMVQYFILVRSLSCVQLIAPPMDCSTPGFPVLHCLLTCAQTHVHWVSDAIQQPLPCCPFSSYGVYAQSFPTSGSFPMSWLFPSSSQRVVASASASVLPMNIQGWFLLGLTGLISLQSKGLSWVFFNHTSKASLFCAQLFLWSNSHICTWLLDKS